MGTTGVQNYLNTIIFCVIAKTVTVIVLAGLFFEPVRKYAVFLLTIEIGLVAIVLWALIKMKRYDEKMAKEAESIMNSAVKSLSCPDYYVRTVDSEDSIVCTNGYLTPDEKFEYAFKGDTSINSITIDEMFRNQTLEGACGIMNSSDNAQFAAIPWTDIKSKCASL